MTWHPQRVTGALYIDMETPRARYECLLCHTRVGPVHGRTEVAEFVASIRTDHRANCPATTEGEPTA